MKTLLNVLISLCFMCPLVASCGGGGTNCNYNLPNGRTGVYRDANGNQRIVTSGSNLPCGGTVTPV